MTYVYKSSTTSLKKVGKNWDLTVEWEGRKKRFWVNFPFPLLKIINQKLESDMNKVFTIKANKIVSLAQFLKENGNHIGYDHGLTMLYDLGNQLQSLERFYMGIPFISISDIVVVDNKHFFYLNDEKVYNFGNNKEIMVDNPHPKSPFISPEMKQTNKLPMRLNFKSGFYSLASLISFCLFNTDISDANKKDVLAPLYTTSLYWALLRMLVMDPIDRFYIII